MILLVMAINLAQSVNAIDLSQGVFDNDPIPGKKAIVSFLVFGERFVTASLERLVDPGIWIIILNAVIAFIQHSGLII